MGMSWGLWGLCLHIVYGKQKLASGCFPGSAYTSTAISLTKQAIKAYYDSEWNGGVRLAVEMLEATGAGITEDERQRIDNEPFRFSGINFHLVSNINEGFIAVTDDGMRKLQYRDEGLVIIDIESETVNFDMWWYVSKDDVLESDNDFDFDMLPRFPRSFTTAIKFKQFDEFEAVVNENPYGVITDAFNDKIICWVE